MTAGFVRCADSLAKGWGEWYSAEERKGLLSLPLQIFRGEDWRQDMNEDLRRDIERFVEENEENLHIALYPNPAKDVITIVETLPETSHISLLTTKGQSVDIRVINNNQIDVSDLPNGIYLMKIQNKYVKIVVEK